MLPVAARLRRSADFTATLRGGRRTSRPSVVFYVKPTGAPARVGFIVSKAVGNAVVRNRVKRRLRHLVARHLGQLRADIVIRALPRAASEPGSLASDVASAWTWSERAVPATTTRAGS
jgi:ribonuclease P protein component